MNKQNDLAILRHSTAHLLAHAMSELFPGVKLTIGPATEEGFFYDFLPERNIKEEDLPAITQRMKEIAEKNIPLTHTEISKEKARELFKDNPFKLELIEGIPGDTVGLAVQGDFYDLCRGGHVASTGELKNFRLQHISGSYWRADRSGTALQRITGTAFPTAKELEDYEKKREEAAMYDHRRLGKQMELFSFHEEGVGFPFFHPKGKRVLNVLMDWIKKEQAKRGYEEVITPTLLNADLWKRSGHYEHYKENMYFCNVDEHEHALKPMNCPGAMLIYGSRPRSYRELPLKMAEFGHVHRHELSGVLNGLLRVRAFTQDDAHIFVTLDQIEKQVQETLELIKERDRVFGFEKVKWVLATKPKKAMGSDEIWDKATNALENALKKTGRPYEIAEGDGAFYGPKIDFHVEDSMGRSWTVGTIQLDFLQPENFDLWYVAPSGQKERPVIIHQAIFGSLERFFAILLEHYKGNFPVWLAPVQARVLPLTDAQRDYAHKIYQELKNKGFRVEIDESSDPLSGQIKRAQQDKVPLMIVIGAKEVEAHKVTVRHANGKQEFNLSTEELINRMS